VSVLGPSGSFGVDVEEEGRAGLEQATDSTAAINTTAPYNERESLTRSSISATENCEL
jgi:hypothetical protein